MTRKADRPEWIRRGDSIVTAIIGGAFLGWMIMTGPGFLGSIVGAILGAIVGWISSKPKPKS